MNTTLQRQSKLSPAASKLQTSCCTPLEDGLSTDEARDLSTAFAALADPARLRLLSLIVASDVGEVCACDLVEPLGKSQPTVSHHLKVLFEAGLVDREKRGTWVWYRPRLERLQALATVLGCSTT